MKLNVNVLLVAAMAAAAVADFDINSARAKLYKEVNFANEQFYDKSGKIRDDVFDKWSNSQLKSWADVHGLPAPQAGKKDELRAFVRKHHKALKDDIDNYATEARQTAQPYLEKAAETVADAGQRLFDSSVETWQDSRLKSFLDARGVTVPKQTTRSKLLDLVRQNKKSAATKHGSWTFETWSTDDLKSWLTEQGDKAAGTRDDLLAAASGYLSKAKSISEDKYEQVANSIANGVNSARQDAFDKWSDSDLKAYLDTYGVKTYQGTKRNELLAHVRSQYRLFTHGADPGSWTRLKDNLVNVGWKGWEVAQVHGQNAFHWGKDRASDLFHAAVGAKSDEL